VAVASLAENPVYEIVFDEAKRGLEHQAGAVDEIRRRASLLLGAASIAASFLGSIALDDKQVSAWGVAAVLTFAAVGIISFVILWPYSWRFVFSAAVLIDDWVEGPVPVGPDELRRELARLMVNNQASNQTTLNRLWRAYQVGIGTLVAMVALWLAELGNLTIGVGK
jgi:hypothetical protein